VVAIRSMLQPVTQLMTRRHCRLISRRQPCLIYGEYRWASMHAR
jgi:hypothetical protein